MRKHFNSILPNIALTIALSISLPLYGADLEEVLDGLVDDIQASQYSLSALEDDIGGQRQKLAQEIIVLQNSVLDLRDKAVASRRLADEETLSLSQIEERLAEWEQQSLYQTRLLQGFLSRTDQLSLLAEISNPMESGVEGVSRYFEQQQTRLYPTWQEEQLVMNDGKLKQTQLLKIGPVTWFRDETNTGLVQHEDGLNIVSLMFENARNKDLQALYQTGQGKVIFDPSLSRAIMLAEANESILQHVQKGGIWVIPILLFALFATFTAIFKAISLVRLPKQLPALAERLEKAYKSGKPAMDKLISQVRGTQGELIKISINKTLTTEQRDEKLYACLLDTKNHLERWLGAIALTASVSPLLGLLGTVSGMIATFKLMTLFGSGDVNSVSSGISEALVTTELGLVVAIPALLAHALMSRKVKSYYAQLETSAIHLSQLSIDTQVNSDE